jgi:hypothetical protein
MAQTIYFWRGSAEVRQDLISALLAANYRVVQLRTLDEVLDRLDRDNPILLIVDASAGDREAAGRVVELAGTGRLFSLVVMFVSNQAKRRTETLAKSFTGLIPIDIPYRLDAVMRGVQALSEGPKDIEKVRALVARGKPPTDIVSPENDLAPVGEGGLEEGEEAEAAREPQGKKIEIQKAAPEQIEDSKWKQGLVRDEVELPKPQKEKANLVVESKVSIRSKIRKRIEDNTANIRQRIRANPDPSKLQNSYGGEAFAIARDPDDFVDDALLPSVSRRPGVGQLLKNLAAQDKWLAAHCKRLAFVSSAIASNLSFGGERDRNIRLSGIFLNWALRDRPVDIVRYDLINMPSKEMQEILAEAYLQSAHFVEQEVGDRPASATIHSVADLLTGVPQLENQKIIEDADLVLGVELSARSCWGLGFWNPAGAYRAIRYFRGENSFVRAKEVRNGLIRVLGEAVTAHVTVRNIFCSLVEDDIDSPQDPEKREASAQAAQEAALRAKEAGVKTFVVPLSDLEPGMLLLEPVLARDGRLVLDANVIINERILYALWQLAAIRALNAKVGVAVSVSAESSA